MDEVGSDARLREIASRFSELEHVEAVALAGSAAVGTSRVLWDRSGWFAYTQRRLLKGYPEGLVRAIVQKNLPVLGAIISSYEQQIRAAFQRKDLACIAHKS